MPLKYRDGTKTYIIERVRKDIDYGADFGSTGISTTAGLSLVGPAGGWIFYAKPSYSFDATGPFSEANGGKPWRYLELSPNYTDSGTGGNTAGTMRWGRRDIEVWAVYGDAGYNSSGAPVALSTDGNGLRNSYRMWAVNQNRSYYDAYNAVEATNAVAYCFGLHAGGYHDWYLPSRGEMYYIWWNLISDRDAGGPQTNNGRGSPLSGANDAKGLNPNSYWSSNELIGLEDEYAWPQSFSTGGQSATFKSSFILTRVRAVRRF